jgi:hypothetical protein
MGELIEMETRNVKAQMHDDLEGIKKDVKFLSSKLDGYSIIYAADKKAIEAAKMRLDECLMWVMKAMAG